jgi:cytoskeletal protein CcmA (bactofilin family)
MATLTNTQISVTYVGLLKTSANTVLTSTAQQITDGSGNNSILYLSTAGVGIGGSPASGKELDVTGNVQVTGDLIVDNITIDGSTITNASGNLTIVNTVDDGDVIFQSLMMDQVELQHIFNLMEVLQELIF